MSSQKIRHPGERLFCFSLIVLSIFLFWQAYNVAGFTSLSSPGAIPLATSAVMIISSCIIFGQCLKAKPLNEERFFYHCLPPIVSIMMGLILIYAVMLESIGFLISSLVFLFIGLQFLYRQSAIKSLVISVVALIIIYCIFRLVFQVVLPEGIVPEREILSTIKQLGGDN